MNAYVDTSAWVKKYVREPGTERLLKIVKRCKAVATSSIAYAEVYAAFSRLSRERSLTRREFSSLAHGFERDWRALTIVEVSEEVLSRIPALVAKFPLRGFDAIHLSSALWLKSRVSSFETFLCSDEGLFGSARAVGLNAIDPESG